MRILFIHNNFPGQYHRIVRRLKGDKNYDMLSASLVENNQPAPIKRIGYKLHREPAPATHPAAQYTEKCVLNGQAVVQSLLPVQKRGWKPDIVLTHSGWGPSLFVKDLWPDTKHLSYFEWYYHAKSADVGFLGEKEMDINALMRTRMKSTAILHDLASMDWGQCPTEFQASQFPDIFKDRMSILHDGVDTEYFSPLEGATFTLGDKVFRRGDPIISYVARGMEPYRGFPQFIEAVARLQKMHPTVQAVVLGEDRVAYGAKRQDGQTWKQAALAEYKPDLDRLHFMGYQPIHVMRDLLRVSAAHVYLTTPFVLSWSLMEAMSTGALIVASDTLPLHEVIDDGVNGLLTPFFEPATLADRLLDILQRPADFESQRAAARQTILERYELNELTDRYLKLIQTVAAGQRPEQ